MENARELDRTPSDDKRSRVAGRLRERKNKIDRLSPLHRHTRFPSLFVARWYPCLISLIAVVKAELNGGQKYDTTSFVVRTNNIYIIYIILYKYNININI